MVTGSLGVSKVRFPNPSFTYTKAFSTSPLFTTNVSALLLPLQAGSWLMSILAGFAAVPAYLTVPLMLPTVLLSMGVAGADAVACFASVAELDCSLSFLLHPESKISPSSAQTSIAIADFIFIVLLPLSTGFGSHTNLAILPRTRRASHLGDRLDTSRLCRTGTL